MTAAKQSARSAAKSVGRAVVAPILGCVVLVMLSGCSIAPATADELPPRLSFAENLDATQTLVGGEWQVRDDPSGRYCSLPSGGSGQSTPALRIGAVSAETPEPSVVAAAVASAWKRWGYAVTQSVRALSIGEVAEVQASGASGEYLIFRASDNALTLQGESA